MPQSPSFDALNVSGAMLSYDSERDAIAPVPKHMPGRFNTNNDLLAYSDDHGNVHIATATLDRLDELQSLGYKKDGLGVPLSNGYPRGFSHEQYHNTSERITAFFEIDRPTARLQEQVRAERALATAQSLNPKGFEARLEGFRNKREEAGLEAESGPRM